MLKGQIPLKTKLIIFDEIHKYRKWRSLVKAIYDLNKHEHQFIVTGSARLDHFKKGGDSLFGCYHHYRLHPFTLSEISKEPTKEDFDLLFKLSGFPEPLFSSSHRSYKRWHLERIERVVYTDINDLENIKDIVGMPLIRAVKKEQKLYFWDWAQV